MTVDEALRAVPVQNRERFLASVRELDERARRGRASELERALALRVLVVLAGGVGR